ncbi:hypothetical protein [Caldivirga sp.]|uniref:hypothetical protein n=1 Tax=Caldivirga sp. TaxID=2080243 RepID=UPI003D0B9F24
MVSKTLVDLTSTAMNLYELQCNGLDEADLYSGYLDLDFAINDIRRLATSVQHFLTPV